MSDLTAARPPLTQRMRPWQWTVLDVLAAFGFLLPVRRSTTLYSDHRLDLLLLGMTVVFPFRRRFPLPALALLTAGTLALVHSPKPYENYQPFAIMLAGYSVAARCGPRITIPTTVALLSVTISIELYLNGLQVISVVAGTSVILAPVLAGYIVRGRRLYTEALAAEHARLAAAEVTTRLAEERMRIARELHDVVAHALSLITVQAGVSAFSEHEGDEMRATLASIEETGRGALVEMRQLLGVLRAPTSDLRPIPSLNDLGDLLAQTAQAGLRVTLRVDGDQRTLPAGVELAAFRIVQESLTNILRHARTATGSITLDYQPEALTVRVANPPPPLPEFASAYSPGAPGHGLAGMAERATLVGGTFQAGPRPGGGFEAIARFPL